MAARAVKRKMTLSERILEASFGRSALLPGPSFREQGKRFSIRASKGYEAAGARLEELRGAQPERQCDAIFLVLDRSRHVFLVVLVELKKGSHGRHALEQLEASFRRLCKNGGAHPADKRPVQELVAEARAPDGRSLTHVRPVLGMIVGPAKLSLGQQQRARLHKEGLDVYKRSEAKGLKPEEIFRFLHPVG